MSYPARAEGLGKYEEAFSSEMIKMTNKIFYRREIKAKIWKPVLFSLIFPFGQLEGLAVWDKISTKLHVWVSECIMDFCFCF